MAIKTERYETVTQVENGILLNTQQLRRVDTLIKKQCCNYSQGKCDMLDNGVSHRCLQTDNTSICCSWFQEAILPLDSLLNAELSQNSKPTTLKKCSICGKPVLSKSNRIKYCSKCAVKVQKTQSTARKQRQRLQLRNAAQKGLCVTQ